MSSSHSFASCPAVPARASPCRMRPGGGLPCFVPEGEGWSRVGRARRDGKCVGKADAVCTCRAVTDVRIRNIGTRVRRCRCSSGSPGRGSARPRACCDVLVPCGADRRGPALRRRPHRDFSRSPRSRQLCESATGCLRRARRQLERTSSTTLGLAWPEHTALSVSTLAANSNSRKPPIRICARL